MRLFQLASQDAMTEYASSLAAVGVDEGDLHWKLMSTHPLILCVTFCGSPTRCPGELPARTYGLVVAGQQRGRERRVYCGAGSDRCSYTMEQVFMFYEKAYSIDDCLWYWRNRYW